MSASAAREEENPGPSSGGFIANVGVKGSVFLGTQQQFLFRNWRLALTISNTLMMDQQQKPLGGASFSGGNFVPWKAFNVN